MAATVMKRVWKRKWVIFLVGLGIASAPSPALPLAAISETDTETPAVSKLKAVIDAAWATGPDLAEAVALVNAEVSANRFHRGPGTPYVQFQMEGIGSSFDYQPNAQNYLRLGTPFDLPWQFTRGRRLGESLDRWESMANEAARVEVAAMAAGTWVRLAAIEERLQVEERRLDRMDRSLRLQTERFKLGEVAGMDVMQLELQRARDASGLRVLQAERRAVQAQIQRLAGDGVPIPSAGDLRDLAEPDSKTVSEPEQGDVEERVANGILYSRLFTRAEKEELLSELIGSTAWGRPEVEVEWEHVPALDGLAPFDAFGFTVSVPLPLGKHGGQQAAVARAEASAAAAALERGRRELVQRAKAAAAAAQSATERLEETESVLDRLPQTEFSLSEQFRLGSISYLVYIDGLARLDDLRLQRIESYETLLLARLELAVVLGDATLFPLPNDASGVPGEAK